MKTILILAMVTSLSAIAYEPGPTTTGIPVGKSIEKAAESTLNVFKIVGEAIGNSANEANISLGLDEDGVKVNFIAKGQIYREIDEPELKVQFGAYEVDLDANVISKDEFITLNELMIDSIRGRGFINNNLEVGMYIAGYHVERIENGNKNYYAHNLVIGGLEFKVYFILSEESKVKLIIAGGMELGLAVESKTTQGAYLTEFISATLQVGEKLFITSFLKAKYGTETEGYSPTTSYLSGGFEVEYQVEEDVSVFTGFNITNVDNNYSWNVPLGIKIKLGKKKKD